MPSFIIIYFNALFDTILFGSKVFRFILLTYNSNIRVNKSNQLTEFFFCSIGYYLINIPNSIKLNMPFAYVLNRSVFLRSVNRRVSL